MGRYHRGIPSSLPTNRAYYTNTDAGASSLFLGISTPLFIGYSPPRLSLIRGATPFQSEEGERYTYALAQVLRIFTMYS